MIAGEGLLVEDGLVPAHEGEVRGLDDLKESRGKELVEWEGL